MLLGALEAGGTKMVCAVGDETGKILEQITIPTTTPEQTMPRITEYFRNREIAALGVGAFGPVNVVECSPGHGRILETPKLPWRQFDLLGSLRKDLDMPMGLDTDVNASCLGEAVFGCARGLDSVVYLTVGTGIGAGILSHGKLMHGMLHPEAGHILVNRHPEDHYQGKCHYHGGCLEGLASGPAIEERWGQKAWELTGKKEVWELEAYYLAQAIVNYILILAPRKIILGGGVMNQNQLFPLIRENVSKLLGGYMITGETADMASYIVPASLGGDQGIMGCVELAKRAKEQSA